MVFKGTPTKTWQIFAHVDDPSKKLINENTTVPQEFQRGELRTVMG
jgi:hypothetical protein